MTSVIDRALAQAAIRHSISAYAKQKNLKARYIAARRWHTQAVNALDARWLAAQAAANKARPYERMAIWQALEDDFSPYLAGVPKDEPKDGS